MATSPLTQSPYLTYAAILFATIWTGFGVNAMFRPFNAFDVFEMTLPTSDADQKTIGGLMVLYGARDLFMGAAVYATAFLGSRKALGLILIAGSSVAAADGDVCKSVVGHGEWNHWGYAPAVMAVGAALFLYGLGDSGGTPTRNSINLVNQLCARLKEQDVTKSEDRLVAVLARGVEKMNEEEVEELAAALNDWANEGKDK